MQRVLITGSNRGLACELKLRGIGVLLLHPGWVRTRMGGASAPIGPEESVRGLLSLVDGYAPNLSGGFFRFDGTRMPW
jgi:NAD(P)-dependent dehydrogenase (short-subunit alcohol dehydrogenase family)